MRGVFSNGNDIKSLFHGILLHKSPLQASSSPIPRIIICPIDLLQNILFELIQWDAYMISLKYVDM